MDSVRVELASREWIALARDYLSQRVGHLDGVAFSVCEVFTDPPMHLADGAGRAAWWLSITAKGVEAGAGERADADLLVEVPYEQALRSARRTYDPDGPCPPSVPGDVWRALVEMHNHLAPRTK